jgi:hypothetical protein
MLLRVAESREMRRRCRIDERGLSLENNWYENVKGKK